MNFRSRRPDARHRGGANPIMNTPSNIHLPISTSTKLKLGICVVAFALVVYSLTIYLAFRSHKFFNTPERINGWALVLSLTSVAALMATFWLVRRFVPTQP